MKLHAVIMAGGSGTRFWPLSRAGRAKQFLDIVSSKSMIQEAVERILPLVPPERISTIADREKTEVIRRHLPGLPGKNLWIEPLARNTAPCLMLATAKIYLEDPETVVAVLTSDHLITQKEKFLKKLRAAADAASRSLDFVTFGIPPTFPSTGYGYIHFSRETPVVHSGEEFYPVREFKEKPKVEQAVEFLGSGDYFWNSGMFVWRADAFARKLEKHAPGLFPFWGRLLKVLKEDDKRGLLEIFREIPSISIDYALMEKARGVLVEEGDFGWSDVGAWSSLFDIWPRDERGNALKGDAILLDSENCLVYNPGKLTALVGTKDLIVVETEDALLVCRKDLDQKVRDIVESLKKGGKSDFL